MKQIYVQYGCGLSAPEQWINFDSSPTLQIQKLGFIGSLLKKRLNTVFPSNVKYGNIISGLPVEAGSCDGIYCSHVLEHLSLADFRKALTNTYKILKPGGIFRCVVPDLEYAARTYIDSLDKGDSQASIKFCGPDTLLGVEKRPKGTKGFIISFLSNSHHLWMWDSTSLSEELVNAGFKNVRPCKFNDSGDPMFTLVEDEGRFIHAVALECSK